MRTRLYLPGTYDARQLDFILDGNVNHDVQLDRDRVIVRAGDDDVPTGCLVWRPAAFVHELHVPASLGQQAIANSLFHEAVRLDIGRRHLIRTALWMVDKDNAPMLRYARDVVHATEQSGVIFTLDLKQFLAPGELTNEGNGQARQRITAR